MTRRVVAVARVERTWAALDRALVQRAEAAVAAGARPGVDPATALLVAGAAAAALAPRLGRADREQAESDLTRVIELAGLGGLTAAGVAVVLNRRLHNDAVLRAPRRAGSKPGRVTLTPFEMAEPALGWRA